MGGPSGIIGRFKVIAILRPVKNGTFRLWKAAINLTIFVQPVWPYMFALNEYYKKKTHSTLIFYRKGSYAKVSLINFSYSDKCKRKDNLLLMVTSSQN